MLGILIIVIFGGILLISIFSYLIIIVKNNKFLKEYTKKYCKEQKYRFFNIKCKILNDTIIVSKNMKNKIIEPACPYLESNNTKNCLFKNRLQKCYIINIIK